MANTFKVKVGEFEFELTEADLAQLDSVALTANNSHVLHQSKSYQTETLRLAQKEFEVSINGNKYRTILQDEYDQLVDKMGLSVTNANVVKEVKAPMPGLVLSISTEAGQSVEKGAPLLILEAMKMENVIKAPGDGVVKNIYAQQGKAVEKGAVLIEFE